MRSVATVSYTSAVQQRSTSGPKPIAVIEEPWNVCRISPPRSSRAASYCCSAYIASSPGRAPSRTRRSTSSPAASVSSSPSTRIPSASTRPAHTMSTSRPASTATRTTAAAFSGAAGIVSGAEAHTSSAGVPFVVASTASAGRSRRSYSSGELP